MSKLNETNKFLENERGKILKELDEKYIAKIRCLEDEIEENKGKSVKENKEL
jgi:hypothetical protein